MCRNPYYVKEYGIYAPCRQCEYCHKKRISNWTIRLQDEATSVGNKAIFITLTYSNDNLPKNFSLDKTHVQDWMKKLRQRIKRKLDNRKIRYFIAGEYGSNTNRPHYHAILYNINAREYKKIGNLVELGFGKNCTHYKDEIWIKGHVTIGMNVNEETLRYTAKYINKKLYGKAKEKSDRLIPFHLSSQGLGIDEAYKNREQIEEDLYILRGGKKCSIPQYYRNKLDITAQDYIKSGIISKKNKELEKQIKEYYEADINIYQEIEEKEIIGEYIKAGQHLMEKVLTGAAMDAMYALRKKYNDNLKSKRLLQESKNPDKI